ncbi:hypothetical protein EV426DRAFT_676120 [Tirmania nivea]|nr:hypothetical protein EV426DRAFT_676120 [Tirmania nivea]
MPPPTHDLRLRPPAFGYVITLTEDIKQLLDISTASLLQRLFYRRLNLQATTMASLVRRQRKEYDPNDALTEEQKQMAKDDRTIMIAAIGAGSGGILVLVLLWYTYRRYKDYSARKRERAMRQAGLIPAPPPADEFPPPLDQPEEIAMNELDGRHTRNSADEEHASRRSVSSGTIPVGLDRTCTDEIIATSLTPARQSSVCGSRVSLAITPALAHTAHNPVVVDTDLEIAASARESTHPAGNHGRRLNHLRDWHQVPPYANDVRTERRRRERDEVRNRHRGIRTPPSEFNDRDWVEISDGVLLNLGELERLGGQLPT